MLTIEIFFLLLAAFPEVGGGGGAAANGEEGFCEAGVAGCEVRNCLCDPHSNIKGGLQFKTASSQ